MDKVRALERLFKNLKEEGFSQESKRISKLILKEAKIDIDIEALNELKEELSDMIIQMEYYPPGAGFFPGLEEIGIFYSSEESEDAIREKLKSYNFTFKGLMASDLFNSTFASRSSTVAKSIEEPYYVITAVK